MPRDAESWLADRGISREVVFDPEAEDALPEDDDPDPTAAPVAVEVEDPAVRAALGFVRRSASAAPQSEGRLRAKLAERGIEEPAIDAALTVARAERLVDDRALLAALVAERRARGHATTRLRSDLRARGFTDADVEAALGAAAPTDPEADAFAVARRVASRHGGVAPETALRRTVDALLRLGHPDALARKAARLAVYADREPERTAGR